MESGEFTNQAVIHMSWGGGLYDIALLRFNFFLKKKVEKKNWNFRRRQNFISRKVTCILSDWYTR